MSQHLTTGAIGFSVGVASAMGVTAAVTAGVLSIRLTPTVLAVEAVFFLFNAAVLAVFWGADPPEMGATA